MCFFVNKQFPKPFVVAFDLFGFKLLETHEETIISPFQEFSYTLSTRYDTQFTLGGTVIESVEEGFHGFYRLNSPSFKVSLSACNLADLYLVKIPKNTRFYIDPLCKEFVSESIEICRRITKLLGPNPEVNGEGSFPFIKNYIEYSEPKEVTSKDCEGSLISFLNSYGHWG